MKLPAELRLLIYRDCFDELIEKKKGLSDKAGICGLCAPSLLHSSSQVRREAAPIFYKECVGNEGFVKGGVWVLTADDPEDMIVRLKAMSASLAQHAPTATVAICVQIRRYKSNFLQLSRLVVVLLSHIRTQHGVLPQNQGQDRVSTDAVTTFDYDEHHEEVGGLSVWYVQGFGVQVLGPLAALDWSGLTL